MSNNKDSQFVFVRNNGGTILYTLDDLLNDSRVTMLNGYVKEPHNLFLKTLKRIHLSSKINMRINLPFKNIWRCSLRNIEWKENIKYYVIFIGSAMREVDWPYINGIRDKYDVRFILFLFDAWNSDISSATVRKYENIYGFDHILSFDPDDVKKNNFTFCYVPYSILHGNDECRIENDLYLAATGQGGRLPVFQDIYEHLRINGISAHYRLVFVPNNKKKYKNEIIYNEIIPYAEILKGVKKSNCILEVLKQGQSGTTLRYYEAVCYNKKLLTNNKNVINLPFYNPKYIHVFEKPEDIDCDWVKEHIPVDYGYDGRFSPIHLLDKIVELDKGKERQKSVKK